MELGKEKVVLEKNYLKWKEMFNKEKETLKEIFKQMAIEIEHIGSTAIENIYAKPIIDIAIGVSNLKDVEKIEKSLKLIYTIKNNKNAEEILLIKEDNKNTYFLIHVMEINSKRYKDVIAFRDYIKANPEALKEYEALKIELAKQYQNDRKTYTKFKNDFIQEILKKLNK